MLAGCTIAFGVTPNAVLEECVPPMTRVPGDAPYQMTGIDAETWRLIGVKSNNFHYIGGASSLGSNEVQGIDQDDLQSFAAQLGFVAEARWIVRTYFGQNCQFFEASINR